MKDVFFGPEETKLHGVMLYADKPGAPGAVLCHPHPKFGGSMHNNVVIALEAALSDAGFTTLRFNSRGVGRSLGAWSGDADAIEDVRRAVALLAADAAVGAIHLAGYSWGALTGLRAALDDDRVSKLAAVAPPTALDPFEFISGCRKPLIMIAGSADEFCNIAALKPFAAAAQAKLNIIPGADHFLLSSEHRAAEMVRDFFGES